MGHGAWGMGHGAWGMGHGEWGMGNGAWRMGHWDALTQLPLDILCAICTHFFFPEESIYTKPV
jgi:hypothetical protein